MKYIGEFVSVNDDRFRVEFITPSTSSDQEIILGTCPIIISYEGDDNVFKPLKLSGATIRIVADNYLFDLYAKNTRDNQCIIYKNDIIIWQGYVTPNIYTQDYLQANYELEIECVDYLSTLDETPYITENKTIASFTDIFKKVLNHSSIPFKYIYAHKFCEHHLSNLYINESNFFDEQGEVMSSKNCLEEILKYLNLTCFQWGTDFYIVDYKLLSSSYNKFYRHDINLDRAPVLTSIKLDTILLQDCNINQTPSLELTECYNKFFINASLYENNILIPEFVDTKYLTFDDRIYKDENVDEAEVSGKKYTIFSKPLLSSVVNTHYYKNNIEVIPEKVSPIDSEWDVYQYDDSASFFRSFKIKGKMSNRPPKSDWEYYVALLHKLPHVYDLTNLDDSKIVLDYTSNNEIALSSNGFIIINFKTFLFPYYKQSPRPYPYALHKDKVVDQYERKRPFCFFRLRIGDYYYVDPKRDDFEARWVHKDEKYDSNFVMKNKGCLVFIGEDDTVFNCWLDVQNTNNNYDDGLGDKTGFVIPTPNFILSGKIQLEIYTVGIRILFSTVHHLKDFRTSALIKDFNIEYVSSANSNDGYYFLDELDDEDSDVVYSNDTTDSKKTREFDDIELKVNTQIGKRYSQSSVLYSDDDFKFQYLKKIKRTNVSSDSLMEEYLLKSYYEQYVIPRKSIQLELEQCISPLSIIMDSNFESKKFIVNSLDYDCQNNTSNVQLIEKE